ncbi:cyclic phosphodiesterase-like [Solanum stenotomum]|uniref:cyclic phosphodiesterase-like n=1 Tax=Solanum stenotomum TaxID=172797 RepID=UPI0020D11BAF|nr:cyclic phosphodiesterase-like [Solanum stenotomum]
MQNVQLKEADTNKTEVYSVWAIPSEDVSVRVKKLMGSLRSEFGGPQFEPHVTVVGAVRLTEEEARDKFRKGWKKVYSVNVEKVVEASAPCCSSFGYNSSSPYMPHMSILYADLTDEEKNKAQENAYILDESIDNLSFQISRLAHVDCL